jgi:hypothetical protein
VHSRFHDMDGDGRIVKLNAQLGGPPDRMTDCLESRLEILSAESNVIAFDSSVLRRACCERVGQFAERLEWGFDYEYWMRIAVYYDVAFLATPLMVGRTHEGQVSMQYPASDAYMRLREDMTAKQLITRNHLNSIPDGRRIKEEIWRRMGLRYARFAEFIERDGWPRNEVRNLVFRTCLEFPELLRADRARKVLLKNVLGKRSVNALKRIRMIKERNLIER